MKINFQPIKTRAYPFTTNSVLNVEKNKILNHAISMNYSISIDQDETECVVIHFEEANHHKETVHIFDSENRCCSCKQYFSHKSSYCKHLAVLDYIQQGYFFEREMRQFQTDYHVKKIRVKESTKNRHYFYDSLLDMSIVHGTGENKVQTVSYDLFLAKNKEKDDLVQVVLPSPFKFADVELYEFQHTILQKMLTAKRAVCCMVMGLGKTLTSIAGMYHLGVKNALIVCPKSVSSQWAVEIKRCLDIDCIFLNKKNIEKFVQAEDGIGICTYQTYARNHKILIQKKYHLVVADEIQFIRNNESKTWSAFKDLESEYFFGLSGTLIENRLDDLYNVMSIIKPESLGPQWKFDFRFKPINSIHREKVLYDNKVQNIKELKELISPSVFSFNDFPLPKIHYQTHTVSMSKDAKVIHDNYINMANQLISKSLNQPLSMGEKMQLQSYYLKARQSCNSLYLVDKDVHKDEIESDKVVFIKNFISSLCKTDKLVVFSEWTTMLDILEQHCPYEFVRFDGSKSIHQRKDAVSRFRLDPSCKVFFSSDAGGLGVDGLQFICNNIMHVETPWNPAKLDQRNGRLHRLGQKSDVFVHYVVTSSSIESKMLDLLKSKRNVRKDTLFCLVEISS